MGAINVFSAGLIKVTMNKEGYENSLITNRKDVNTYYAVRSADGESYDVYYTPGASSVTWNIFNGLYVKSVSFLAQPTAVSKTITAAGWATLYTPYALDFSGVTGLTAYTATRDGSTVTLNEVENVPANTGVVLKGAENTYNIPVIASSETAKGDLAGSATEDLTYDANATMDYYFLGINGANEAQFTKLTSGTITAGKAYLPISKSVVVGAKLRVVIAGDDATAINGVESEKADNGAIYNLSGQRVGKDYKGIVIKNGKKFMNK